MKTIKRSALILLTVALAACGQQLVEFAKPGTGTGPGAAPTVISTIPASGATNVLVGSTVQATFSTAMKPVTMNTTTFTLKDGLVAVGGAVSYAGTTATFAPSAALATNTLYTASISTGAQNLAGTPMASPYTWTFTTGASSPCALAPVDLLTAGNFVVLAGSNVNNTGLTSLTGDLGVSPGSSVSGFPPGVVSGTQHVADPTADQAKLDLTTAYNDAAGRTLCRITVATINLGGQTLTPGLYWSGTSLEITSGTLTLDAQGDSSAVFIFQSSSTLTTTSGLGIVLAGGAKASNIFWQVGSSATIGTTSAFSGTIMADQSITLNTGATLDGRALARIGAVTLDANTVVKPAP